jgi:hypothetical protein
MVLYWNSINMFVELPQVANKMYAVHERTGVEMIIFFDDDPDVTAVGENLFRGEKIAWAGYGNYQP